MTLQDLIRLVSAQLATLNSAKATATALGDLERIVELDIKIEQTQLTLDQLTNL